MNKEEIIEKLRARRYPFRNESGKWGYTDIFGQVVVPPTLNEVEPSIYNAKGARDLDTKSPLTVRELINNYTDYPLGDSKEIIDENAFWKSVLNRTNKISNNNLPLGPIDKDHIVIRREMGPDDFAMFGTVKYGIEDHNNNLVGYYDYDDIFPASEGLIRVAEYKTFIGLSPFTPDYFDIGFVEKCLDEDFRKIKDEVWADILKWGYINNKAEEVIPIEYDNAGDFHEGLAAVCKKEEWGYIDKNNKTIIPFKFEWADSFEDGFARVLYAGTFYIIDKEGYCYETYEDLYFGEKSKFYE